jgi:hypothetical protein
MEMQETVQRIAQITHQDPAFTRGQFRTWLSAGLIPAAEIRGEGVGTRRSYDREAVFVGAALVRLSRFGVQGEDLKEKRALLGDAWKTLSESVAPPEPVFFVMAVGNSPGLVFSTFVAEPTAEAVLQDFEGGGAFILDVQGLFRLATA